MVAEARASRALASSLMLVVFMYFCFAVCRLADRFRLHLPSIAISFERYSSREVFIVLAELRRLQRPTWIMLRRFRRRESHRAGTAHWGGYSAAPKAVPSACKTKSSQQGAFKAPCGQWSTPSLLQAETACSAVTQRMLKIQGGQTHHVKGVRGKDRLVAPDAQEEIALGASDDAQTWRLRREEPRLLNQRATSPGDHVNHLSPL